MSYHWVNEGLGDASYGQDIPAPNYEVCSNPFDSGCIARNQQKNAQWNQSIVDAANAQHLTDCLQSYPAALCYSQFGGGPAAAPSSQGGGYVAPQPVVKGDDTKVTPGSQTLPTSGVVWGENSTTGPVWQGAPVVAPSQGQVVTSSPGTATFIPASTASTGFDLSSIPTWAWLAGAAAVAFFMFKGGR